jgi:hypothetical protein
MVRVAFNHEACMVSVVQRSVSRSYQSMHLFREPTGNMAAMSKAEVRGDGSTRRSNPPMVKCCQFVVPRHPVKTFIQDVNNYGCPVLRTSFQAELSENSEI